MCIRDSIHTIRDAVTSALNQQTTFPFNVIVIDNHSTDGTPEALQELSADTVSYTHLDVYKRQKVVCWFKAEVTASRIV